MLWLKITISHETWKITRKSWWFKIYFCSSVLHKLQYRNVLYWLILTYYRKVSGFGSKSIENLKGKQYSGQKVERVFLKTCMLEVLYLTMNCVLLNYAILRVGTYQNYNNSKQYMYHQLPNFFCLKEMGEINNSWLVYKNPILRHGDTQYYFTHVATLLRTILQHFSICFKAKKGPKILEKLSCLYLEHCIEGTKSPRNLQFNTQIYRTDLQFPFWNCRKTEFNGLFFTIFSGL